MNPKTRKRAYKLKINKKQKTVEQMDRRIKTESMEKRRKKLKIVDLLQMLVVLLKELITSQQNNQAHQNNFHKLILKINQYVI